MQVPTIPIDVPRVLPRGSHSLDRETVLASQRGRIIEAMAEAVAAHGYRSTTVAEIIATAGVGRKTFYEHFRDKEECFLAVWDTASEFLIHRVAAAADPAAPWHERLSAGLRAYLAVLAEETAFARTLLIEGLTVGGRALERRDQVHARLADMIAAVYEQGRSQEPELATHPPQIFRAVVGAIEEVVIASLIEDTAPPPELEQTVLQIALRLLTAADLSAT